MEDKNKQIVKCPHCGKEGKLEKSKGEFFGFGLIGSILSMRQKPTICPNCGLDVYKTYDK